MIKKQLKKGRVCLDLELEEAHPVLLGQARQQEQEAHWLRRIHSGEAQSEHRMKLGYKPSKPIPSDLLPW